MKPVDPAAPILSSLGLASPPPLEIECEAFTGSLAMLFQVAKQRRIDLLGVPLLPVCEAYLTYLIESEGSDLDAAASALLALAYLVERKAWALIPVPDSEPEIDDELEFVDPSVQEYSTVIEALRVWQDERERTFFRLTGGDGHYEMPFELEEATPDDLARALERLLRNASPDPPEILSGERRSLAEQMVVVLSALSADFKSISDTIVGTYTRTEAVWWFLALLELIRLGQAAVRLVEGEARFAKSREVSEL